MAKGKDAFSYALTKLIFDSITFEDDITKKYWQNLIPSLKNVELDKDIENPAQKVELEFSTTALFPNDKKPKIILCENTKKINTDTAEIILEASSGEDCARLLFISHVIAQRFATHTYLVISKECLEKKLISKPEHIPFPPSFVIRDKTWKPDIVRPNHPALSFKRIFFGNGKGPRDKAKLLIISHGKNSLKINEILKERNVKNIRHLELQTLKPISKEIIEQAKKSVKEIVTTIETFSWLPEDELITPIDFEDFNNLIN